VIVLTQRDRPVAEAACAAAGPSGHLTHLLTLDAQSVAQHRSLAKDRLSDYGHQVEGARA
jgi:hypothetical protein